MILLMLVKIYKIYFMSLLLKVSYCLYEKSTQRILNWRPKMRPLIYNIYILKVLSNVITIC